MILHNIERDLDGAPSVVRVCSFDGGGGDK